MIKHFINKLSDSSPPIKRREISRDKHSVRVEDVSPFALEVVDELRDAGYQAYLVGGCVRDAILDLAPKDFDVATDATPEQVKRLYRRARIIGRRFQIVHVQNRHEVIEVTTFRGHHDSKSSNSHKRRRGEPAARKSGKGMLMRDNVFGSMEEDAVRRDFSCNALYFDTDTEAVIDFIGGFDDLKDGLLRTIGDAGKRFQEDPVRMMRAIRFQAKLGLRLDKESQRQLAKKSSLILEVSAARLFDEVIKLLLHPKAVRAFELFNESGLFRQLFPASAKQAEENQQLAQLLDIGVQNTEQRLSINKGVSPFYLYATLLWPALQPQFVQLIASNESPSRAMERATSSVLAEQAQFVSIPKRFALAIRDTWYLQTQLDRRQGDRAERLLAHPKFRAAYDFLLMREASGENLNGLGNWWTKYQEAGTDTREEMRNSLPPSGKKHRRRRNRRKKPPTN